VIDARFCFRRATVEAGSSPQNANDGGNGRSGESMSDIVAIEPPVLEVPAPPTAKVVDVSQIPDEALKDRLERHARKTLADTLGVKTPEEAKALRDEHAQLKKADEDRKLAALTESERVNKLLDAEKGERQRLTQALAESQEANALLEVIHAKGVKNAEYARFLVDKARRESNGVVDIGETISAALGDPLTRAALGIVDETTPVPTKASTSSADRGSAPKPPVSGGSGSGVKSAKDFTPAEWLAYKRAHSLV